MIIVISHNYLSEIHYGFKKLYNPVSLYIWSLKVSLQILRCFGHLKSRLRITGLRTHRYFYDQGRRPELSHEEKSLARIFTYIHQYCAETLNEFNAGTFNINEFYLENPLLNVESLSIDGSRIKKDWLSRMFPKLRALTVRQIGLNLIGIENHFPNLERLEIYCDCHNFNSKHNIQLFNVLSLNPQLHVLRIPFYDDANLFRFISQKMPHLKELSFVQCFQIDQCFKKYSGPTYDLKNLRSFGISCFGFTNRERIPIPFSFGSELEELHIESFSVLNCEQQFVEFVQKYRSICKITMMLSAKERSIEIVPRVLEAFPSARQNGIGLWVIGDFLGVEGNVSTILKRCGTLKRYEKRNDRGYLKYWFYAD